MDDQKKTAAAFARTPLGETSISSRLCRLLKCAGYSTLHDAFDADEADVREVVGRSFNEFTNLVDSYYDYPDKFVEIMSQERPTASSNHPDISTFETPIARAPQHRQPQTVGRPQTFVSYESLSTPYGEKLKDCEKRAKEVFDDLCDRYENVLVYQAFPYFSLDLDDIRESFLRLFSAYPSHPTRPLAIAEKYLPNVFVIFVADLARNTFSEDNLWGNFFEVLPMNQNAQTELKKTFVRILGKREMPLYAQDEAAHYYFYTALLHGGLSKDAWEDLWESSLIPMAKELRRGRIGFGGEISGYSILQEVKNADGRYAPKMSVARILQKASDSTIAPLFESAMRVAAQSEARSSSRDEYVLIDNLGLPEIAVVALHDVTEKRSSQRLSTGIRKQRSSTPKRKFVDLPSANLTLDLERGLVLIRWTRKQYSDAFIGDRIDFYVDGKKQREQYFESRLNKCILDDVEVEVSPQARYDVELRLMKRIEEEGDTSYEQKSSLEQSFLRSKPGCFEFIRGIDGMFHLRSRGDRVTRRRRIAYILKEGYYIEPGTGMTPVSEYEVSHKWEGTSAFVYDVDPGASGSIFKESATGEDEEVAVWQESYRAHINKHHVIGETVEGLDLYGYSYCKNGDNAGLPYIIIEVSDGLSAFNDLEISCSCDGKSVSVPRKVLREDSYGESSASQIALPLELTSEINWLSEVVEIVARQISAGGKVVFRYRFATVPLQEFKLEEAHVENGIVVVQYSFHPRLGVYVTDVEGNRSFVSAREQFWKRALLKDEFMPLTISSEDGSRSVNAKLALAAIDVELPEGICATSSKRPICLADALTWGTSKGEVRVKSTGWRHNRNIIVGFKAGHILTSVLYIKELKQPSEHPINLFSVPGDLVPHEEIARDCPLFLLVDYGEEDTPTGTQIARTEVKLLNFREGLGFKEHKVASKGDKLVLVLDGPVECDVQVQFRRTGRRPKDLVEASMRRGETELAVPESVAYEMRTKKEVVATFSPKSRFGKPRLEYSYDLPLKG